MSEITAVTFDLWQTLLVDNRELGLTRSNARLEGVQRILEESGEEFDSDRISEAYWDCYRQCAAIREGLLDVSFPEQIDIFVESISPGLGMRLSRKALDEITSVYADSFLDYPPPAHTEAVSVLRGVREMGMRIGLISNTGMTPGTTFRTYLENTGMLGFFDALTFSDEVKMSKPAREIFPAHSETLFRPIRANDTRRGQRQERRGRGQGMRAEDGMDHGVQRAREP